MAVVVSLPAQAAIIVSDEFNGTGYTSGVDLAGLNSGSPVGSPGWTNAWAKTANGSEISMTITSGLSFTDSLGNVLTTAGNAVTDNSATTKGGDFRNFSPPGGSFANGSSIWFSALVNTSAAAGSDLKVFALANSADPVSTLGYGFDVNGSGVNVELGSTLSASLGGTLGSTMLLVAKLTFSSVAGADSITGWLNPVLSSTPTGGTTLTGDFTNSSILYAMRGGAAWSGVFDELRIGDTFADVTPFTAVPEPSSYALVAIGVIGLCMAGRRKTRGI